MAASPTVVVFDVNETLSDMEPLRARFAGIGAPEDRMETWFAATLRDGFALTAAGAYADFADVASASLRTVLAGIDVVQDDPEGAVQSVLGGLTELDVHPDVPEGMRKLRQAGVRLVALTNGSVKLSEGMFERAGVLDLLERRMSVSEPRRWKPAVEAYHYAAEKCGVPVQQMALVAVHPWDTDGAKRAGMISAWINRKDRPYPQCFLPPDVTGADLPAVADALLALDP